MVRNKTTGGIGTNQYGLRGRGRTPSYGNTAPALAVAGSGSRGRSAQEHQAWETDQASYRFSPVEAQAEGVQTDLLLAQYGPGAEVIEHLAGCRHWHARFSAAESPDASPQVLSGLVADPSSLVRGAVARHPNATNSDLTSLAVDPLWHVRKGVLDNPSSSAAIRSTVTPDSGLRPGSFQRPDTGRSFRSRQTSPLRTLVSA